MYKTYKFRKVYSLFFFLFKFISYYLYILIDFNKNNYNALLLLYIYNINTVLGTNFPTYLIIHSFNTMITLIVNDYP